MRRWPVIMLPLLAAAGCGLALHDWLAAPVPAQSLRLPEKEGSVAEAATVRASRRVDLAGIFTAGSGTPGATTQSWPGFRGPRRDNVADTPTPLARQWPAGGPPVRWQVTVGDGHAGPAVLDGRVYLLDYDEQRGGDVLRCLSFDDGREIWQRFYAVRTKRNHGISRTIPAVDADHVVTLGPQCHVLCVDRRTGAYRWGVDLVAGHGATVPLWYAGQCPLLDNGVAVLAPAGPSLLIGVEAATGTVLWRAPNPDGWRMSHASVMPARLCGTRQYLYAAIGGIAGVAAEGPEAGTILWRTTAFSPGVVAPSPVVIGDNRFLQTAGYGGGSMLFEVRHGDDGWSVTHTATLDRRLFACEQQTPVFRDGLLFTVLPSDGGTHRQEFVCMDPSGRVRWTSGPERRYGLGPFLALGSDRFVLMDDHGLLTLARATADGYDVQGQIAVLDGRDAWGPMAFVDGRLLLRDSTRLVCLDLREQP